MYSHSLSFDDKILFIRRYQHTSKKLDRYLVIFLSPEKFSSFIFIAVMLYHHSSCHLGKPIYISSTSQRVKFHDCKVGPVAKLLAGNHAEAPLGAAWTAYEYSFMINLRAHHGRRKGEKNVKLKKN